MLFAVPCRDSHAPPGATQLCLRCQGVPKRRSPPLGLHAVEGRVDSHLTALCMQSIPLWNLLSRGAEIPAHLERNYLLRNDGKRSDSPTLVPWAPAVYFWISFVPILLTLRRTFIKIVSCGEIGGIKSIQSLQSVGEGRRTRGVSPA